MMQMLEAGGMPVLVDDRRPPDEDNPRGYYEYEEVKSLGKDGSWLSSAGETAVKVVSLLLYDLPPDLEYRVLFMTRDLDEVLRSQAKMLKRRGEPPGDDDRTMRTHFGRHLRDVRKWLADRRHVPVLECEFERIIDRPADAVRRIVEFLDCSLDQKAMSNVVDPSLYRQKSASR